MIPPKAAMPAPPPVAITLAKLLVVEGETPKHFCEALLKHLQIDQTIEIRSFGSISNLAYFLKAVGATQGFGQVRSLGIVRDAEDKPAAEAHKSIATSITNAALMQNFPGLAISAFVLPDDQGTGNIETLCMASVRQEQSLAVAVGCVDAFFDCLQQGQVVLPAQPALAKNHAQAYLATREEAQLFPGIAASRKHWPWDVLAMEPLKRFLLKL